VLSSCGREESVNKESQLQGAKAGIHGMYELRSIKGHTSSMQGSVETKRAVGTSYRASEGPLVNLQIGTSGTGYLEAGSTCSVSIKQPGLPATSEGSVTSRFVGGVFAAFHIFSDVYKSYTCDPKIIMVKKEILLEKNAGFLGGKVSFAANVGVYKETSKAKAADQECRLLSKFRYFTLGTSQVCIGELQDGSGNVKMLLLRAGEIHAQRLILAPSQAKNF
jgi:hypothetical protein